MRTNILKIAASLALALGATQAFAHAQLEKATPPVGGTVSPPTQIRLEFSEGVEPRFTGVTLTSSGGAAVPLGRANVEAGDQKVLIVPIAKALSPGAYTVHWHAVSVDTHHTQGTFEFTVK
jgi:copper resistance protein C